MIVYVYVYVLSKEKKATVKPRKPQSLH